MEELGVIHKDCIDRGIRPKIRLGHCEDKHKVYVELLKEVLCPLDPASWQDQSHTHKN